MKKLLVLFLMIASIGLLAACEPSNTDKPSTDDTNADKLAPAFKDVVDGKLVAIEHLKGEEVNFLEGVSARDNKTSTADIKIEVSDFAGYNKETPGEYTIVYTATDEAKNTATIKRDVTVFDTVVAEYNAMRIGDLYAPMDYNSEVALTRRTSDKDQMMECRYNPNVQVMDADFYLKQVEANKETWAPNGGVPHLAWASVAFIFDTDFKLVYGRLSYKHSADTAYEYIDGELVKSPEGEQWYYSTAPSADKPNGSLVDIDKKVKDLLTDNEGYVVFATAAEPQDGRTFLFKGLYSSDFVNNHEAGEPNIDYDNLDIEINVPHKEVMQKPDAMSAPVIGINQHILTVTSENTKNVGKYELTFTAEGKETVVHTLTASSNSVKLYEIIKLEDTKLVKNVEYTITCKAFTNNIYEASDSLVSEKSAYTFTDISGLATPELTLEGNNISWALDKNAAEYQVYARVLGFDDKLIGTTTDSSFAYAGKIPYSGTVAIYVIAIAKEGTPYLNSVYSRASECIVNQEDTKTLTSGDISVDVLEIKAAEYFTRRNTAYSDDKTGLASSTVHGVFLIKDIFEITKDTWVSTITVNEAYSTIVLLDKDSKVKMVRSILPTHEYLASNDTANGWKANSIYTSNLAQLVGLKETVEEGDQLLVFKNGNKIDYTQDTVTANIDARQIGAHLFIASGATVATEAWRGAIDTFKNCKDIVFEIK